MKSLGKKLSLFVVAMACLGHVQAVDPAWWTAPATRIIDPNSAPSNYSVLNLGQLKHVAQKAKEHLDLFLPTGAGSEVNALVAGLQSDHASNYAPANLGQLKAIAKPFYDRLNAIGFDTKANLKARGYPSNWASIYPWNPATPVSENYSPANIGQLKMVFSFDLSGDDDGDGIPNGLDGFGDTDGDGIIDSLDTDSDNDNVPDSQEVALHTDPKSRDTDSDGSFDGNEVLHLTNPRKKDNPVVKLSVTAFTQP